MYHSILLVRFEWGGGGGSRVPIETHPLRHNKSVVLTAYSISSRFFRVKSTPFGMGTQAREGAVAALVGYIAVVSAQLPL